MLIVALKENGKILKRFEAWAQDAVLNAVRWVYENGYTPACDEPEITLMGDMIIWVA